MEKKWEYCYPSGLEKTLCKWDIYVPLVTKGLRYKNLMKGGFRFYMIREKAATFFHLQPKYGLQEHIHLITAVNCTAKRNAKQGTRKKVSPNRLVAREVRRLGIKTNPQSKRS